MSNTSCSNQQTVYIHKKIPNESGILKSSGEVFYASLASSEVVSSTAGAASSTFTSLTGGT